MNKELEEMGREAGFNKLELEFIEKYFNTSPNTGVYHQNLHLTKYEYRVIHQHNLGEIINLAQLGDEGWGLCGITDDGVSKVWVFGRIVRIHQTITCGILEDNANNKT